MNVEDLKQAIERRTGVPAAILTGETAEEAIAQAKAILTYKSEQEAQRPKSTAEQFSEWASINYGEGDHQDTAVPALEDIKEAARVAAGGYPIIRDSEVDHSKLPDGRSAKEKFAELVSGKLAHDPFTGDGWTRFR